MNGLETLSAELDAWISAGEKAKIWWRDDDASYPSNKLDKLIETDDKGVKRVWIQDAQRYY